MIKKENNFQQIVDINTMTTSDGVRLKQNYIIRYRMEKNGQPVGNPINFVRTGKELCRGISSSIEFNRFARQNIKLPNKGDEIYWTRHLCKEFFISVCTFKVRGTSLKVESDLNKVFSAEIVSECKKFVRRKKQKVPGLIPELLDGYMWGKIPKRTELNTVEITDIVSLNESEIEEFILDTDFSIPEHKIMLESLYGGSIVAMKEALRTGYTIIGEPSFTKV